MHCWGACGSGQPALVRGGSTTPPCRSQGAPRTLSLPRRAGLSSAQAAEVRTALQSVPRVSLDADFSLEGEVGDITQGDVVTCTARVVLQRSSHQHSGALPLTSCQPASDTLDPCSRRHAASVGACRQGAGSPSDAGCQAQAQAQPLALPLWLGQPACAALWHGTERQRQPQSTAGSVMHTCLAAFQVNVQSRSWQAGFDSCMRWLSGSPVRGPDARAGRPDCVRAVSSISSAGGGQLGAGLRAQLPGHAPGALVLRAGQRGGQRSPGRHAGQPAQSRGCGRGERTRGCARRPCMQHQPLPAGLSPRAAHRWRACRGHRPSWTEHCPANFRQPGSTAACCAGKRRALTDGKAADGKANGALHGDEGAQLPAPGLPAPEPCPMLPCSSLTGLARSSCMHVHASVAGAWHHAGATPGCARADEGQVVDLKFIAPPQGVHNLTLLCMSGVQPPLHPMAARPLPENDGRANVLCSLGCGRDVLQSTVRLPLLQEGCIPSHASRLLTSSSPCPCQCHECAGKAELPELRRLLDRLRCGRRPQAARGREVARGEGGPGGWQGACGRARAAGVGRRRHCASRLRC